MSRLSPSNSRNDLNGNSTSSSEDAETEKSLEKSSEKNDEKGGKQRARAGTWSMTPAKPTMSSKPPGDTPPPLPQVPNQSSSTKPGPVSERPVTKLDLSKLNDALTKEKSTNPSLSARIAPSSHRRMPSSQTSVLSATSTARTPATATTTATTTTATTATTTAATTAATTATISVSNAVPGVSASTLTGRSRVILAAAMTKGTIKPELLAYVMLDVQSAGLNIPLEKIEASGPFLRAKVTVNDLLNSSGVAYDPINLVEKFLEPAAAAAFNTAEWASLAERLFKNYQPVATEVETLAAELKGSDMHNNEKTKRIMDPVIQPLVEKVCGRDQKFAQSGLPESWKNMVMEIDRATMKWAQKTQADNPKELNRIRREALVLFIATRGLLPSLSPLIASYCAKMGVRSTKLNAYISSYFSFHIENLLVDIMLSREDDKGEKVDIEARKILRGLTLPP